VSRDPKYLTGVIEGFYGPPWSAAERAALFGWMSAWGLNTYMYGPKDDLKDRTLWREPYSEIEAADLGQLIQAAEARKIGFIFALSPGLDITYSALADREALKRKLTQILTLGARHFCLLFDDIPDRMQAADLERWGSLAAAQAALANEIFLWIRNLKPEARFLFCPTPYCGRMAQREHGGRDYLAILGRELLQEIGIFWTGPEIISETITVAQARDLSATLRRKPILWENLHANDYDGRRFYCGPYAGRPRELREELQGVLFNPNCEFPLNYVPLQTMSRFLEGPGMWDPRQAYLVAMQEWHASFETAGPPISFKDFLIFGDCFYLPFQEGAEAESLFALAEVLLQSGPAAEPQLLARFRQQSEQLKTCCARMADLKQRPLFHALYRRAWELREELDLLQRGVEHFVNPNNEHLACHSDFHLPKTYRGGFVARLQKLLVQEGDGGFRVASTPAKPNKTG